jgi:hypothetical protein
MYFRHFFILVQTRGIDIGTLYSQLRIPKAEMKWHSGCFWGAKQKKTSHFYTSHDLLFKLWKRAWLAFSLRFIHVLGPAAQKWAHFWMDFCQFLTFKTSRVLDISTNFSHLRIPAVELM